MDNTALFKMTYGMFLLTAKENGFDNGCIINTAVQVAENPIKITISVIKDTKTCDMILNTHKFNLSSITESADSVCSREKMWINSLTFLTYQEVKTVFFISPKTLICTYQQMLSST